MQLPWRRHVVSDEELAQLQRRAAKTGDSIEPPAHITVALVAEVRKEADYVRMKRLRENEVHRDSLESHWFLWVMACFLIAGLSYLPFTGGPFVLMKPFAMYGVAALSLFYGLRYLWASVYAYRYLKPSEYTSSDAVRGLVGFLVAIVVAFIAFRYAQTISDPFVLFGVGKDRSVIDSIR